MKNKERKVDIRGEENLTTRFSTRRTIPIPQPKDYSRVMLCGYTVSAGKYMAISDFILLY
jgi:hypothetical protein